MQLLQPALEIPVPHGIHAISEAGNIKGGILSPPTMAECLVDFVIDLHKSSSDAHSQCGCVMGLSVKGVAHRNKQHYRDEDDSTDGLSGYPRAGVVTSDVVEQYAAIEHGMRDS
jgi:hypothetical protein